MTLFTRTVLLDDASLLSKLDPGMWPQRHGNIEGCTSDDQVAQATEDFMSCRFDPHNLKTQLAKLGHSTIRGGPKDAGGGKGSIRCRVYPVFFSSSTASGSEQDMNKPSPEELRHAAARLRQESEREKQVRENQNRLVRGNVDKWAQWRDRTKKSEASDKQ